MKAARLEDGTLEIQDLPSPEPGHEEALIKISSAGVCHSDLTSCAVTGRASPAVASLDTRPSAS